MPQFRNFITPAVCALLAIGATATQADAPFIDPANDEQHFGPIENILFWTPEQKVAGFRNIEKMYWTRRIESGDAVLALPYDLHDLGDLAFSHDGKQVTVDEFVRQMNVAGLLVIKDGSIVYERYELGNTPETVWLSWSVAKSVTSLLVGAAIRDGYIASVDEKVSDYLPRLKNSSYDQATIRNILQMTSGVEWDEDYSDRDSDINSIKWDTLSLYEYLRNKPRASKPGQRFNYNTAEINLVGTLLRSAIGNNLSTYLSEKIWRPFGMEFDAYWQLSESGGGEFGGSSLSATLRDYGRLGMFALGNGRLPDGTQVLPDAWIMESTTPSRHNDHYGYLWWLRSEGVFAASGIFGQAIHVDTNKNIVIVMHSARDKASDPADWALQLVFFKVLTEAVGNN